MKGHISAHMFMVKAFAISVCHGITPNVFCTTMKSFNSSSSALYCHVKNTWLKEPWKDIWLLKWMIFICISYETPYIKWIWLYTEEFTSYESLFEQNTSFGRVPIFLEVERGHLQFQTTKYRQKQQLWCFPAPSIVLYNTCKISLPNWYTDLEWSWLCKKSPSFFVWMDFFWTFDYFYHSLGQHEMT